MNFLITQALKEEKRPGNQCNKVQHFAINHPSTDLTDWSMGISKIDEKVVTFQIKMHYVLPMQVFHTKGHIHCNQQTLPLVKVPDKNLG